MAGILLATLASCTGDDIPELDFRQEMRDFVIRISTKARENHPGFIVIPQNGIELVTGQGEESYVRSQDYVNAIDGNGQEDLFYGFIDDNEPTPEDETGYLVQFLDFVRDQGKVVLVTDYCSSDTYINDSYTRNKEKGYVSFAATSRELDLIPMIPTPIHMENHDTIKTLSQVRNFLYLINYSDFSNKEDLLEAIAETNYDLLILDLFFFDGIPFMESEIRLLKTKANGGQRLAVCYLSIGEAESYRYYWQPGWRENHPQWIIKENPDWDGNFKVKYWEEEWQQIICGEDDSYLQEIVSAGFDGVYLDIIDAFEYFE